MSYATNGQATDGLYYVAYNELKEMMRAQKATLECDLFIAIGSSLVVFPAAGFSLTAKQNGAKLVILNREATDMDDFADLVVHAEIGPTLGEATGVE